MMKTPLFLVLFLVIPAFEKSFAEVVINDNGYSGLIIAIDEDVPESNLLLESIQEMITQASVYLYKSTRQRAYFEQATIVVPSTWSASPKYKTVPYYDYINSAEVRIEPYLPKNDNIPYTVQLGECGERGQYIHFTSDFLLENSSSPEQSKNSRNGRIFHHEWAHLRYGVFNEYGERWNRNSPIFYKDNFDKIRPNGCATNIVGRIRRSDGKSPCVIDVNMNLIEDCTFYPDLQTGITNGTGKSSPMYMPELDSADEFCDSNGVDNHHDPYAPTMHNRMCNTLSVFEVILSNADFKDGSNSPREIINLTTQIDIIQTKRTTDTFQNVVLVLDVSGSMAGDKMTAMQEATARLIKYHIKEECNIKLAMVSFSDDSKVLADLTLVTNSSKDGLIEKIPKNIEGGTAIGKGILEAIQVLSESGESTEKSNIILLTDGEENVPPMVADIFGEIKQAGVVIYTLAIGNQASKTLEEISQMTGGKAYLYDPYYDEKSMDSILNLIIIDIGCNDLLPIIIINRGIMVAKGKDVEAFFYVDSGLGSIVIFITYNYPTTTQYTGKTPIVNVTDPNGKMFDQESPEYTKDENLRSIQFNIPQAQPGEWKCYLYNPGDEDVHFNLMVTSDANDDSKDKPLRLKSWVSNVNLTYPQVSKVYAAVTKDNQPVVRAQVVATCYGPFGQVDQLTLNDNGKGADIYANDGVYTEYFALYSGSGRYAVDITVISTTNTRLYNGSDFSRAPVLPILDSEVESEEPQSEFLLTDLQQVNENFETSAIYNDNSETKPDYDFMDAVDDFERFASAGTFVLNDWTSDDLIPPSRIMDMTVVATNLTARTVNLQWTSTGDDMNDGQANSIELRYHNDSVFLVRSFNESFSDFTILSGSLRPLEANEIHSIILQLPDEDKFSILNSSRNIFFAARAIDEAKNVAQVSNAAIANFPTSIEATVIEEPQTSEMDYKIAFWITFAVAVVLLVVLFIMACIMTTSQNKK